MIDEALRDHVSALAAEYTSSVRARRALGDLRPEYHAQAPKVKAYGALMHAGLSPREAIAAFRRISEEH
jgi:hypothetical protein